MNIKEVERILGRKGGKAKTEAKKKAARLNGKKGGRKAKIAVAVISLLFLTACRLDPLEINLIMRQCNKVCHKTLGFSVSDDTFKCICKGDICKK